MKKRILSVFAALCMLLSLSAVSVFAAENLDGDVVATVTYEFGGETYTDSYTTLEAALSDSSSGDLVTLVSSYTLSNSTTLPAGVQLIIPTSASYNDTVTGNNASGNVVVGTAYATLTIPTGKELTVNGTLLVAGNQQSTQPKTGCLTGDYGKIDVAGDLTINNGGKLYARGEISGAGTVTANNGSTVYQLFQIHDWRGGTASMMAYSYYGTFPFNLYKFDSITATTVYGAGASLIGQYYIYADSVGNTGEITIIGSAGLYEFDAAAATGTGNITFTHSNDITTVTLNGSVKTGNLSINAGGYPIDSTGYDCPIGYGMKVVVNGSLEVANKLKVLPGCEITVNSGASLTVDSGAALELYTAGGYLPTYNRANWSSASNATLTVNGSLTNNGSIASSDQNAANLIGFAADGGFITVKEFVLTGTGTDVTFYTATK